jgi:hypothetical protein
MLQKLENLASNESNRSALYYTSTVTVKSTADMEMTYMHLHKYLVSKLLCVIINSIYTHIFPSITPEYTKKIGKEATVR